MPRVLTEQELADYITNQYRIGERVAVTAGEINDLLATVEHWQRSAQQNRRLADDYQALLKSQRGDLDAVLRASGDVYLAAKTVLGIDEYDHNWRDECANLQWKLRRLRRVMKAAGVVFEPD